MTLNKDSIEEKLFQMESRIHGLVGLIEKLQKEIEGLKNAEGTRTKTKSTGTKKGI